MSVEDVHAAAGGLVPELAQVIPQQRADESSPHVALSFPDGRPLRVLAVGINFGPEHTGIAPYTTQLCSHLVAAGADVSVLTGIPHYPAWTVAREDRWRLRRTEASERLQVRRLRHFVPRTQSAAKRGVYELTFALNAAVQSTRKMRPDVVVAIVPSLLSAVTAERIAKKHGVPLVLWVQDLMGPAAAQSGIEGGGRVARYVGAIERWLLNRAAQVVVINGRFQEYVQATGVDSGRTTITPNWTHVPPPSGADRSVTRSKFGWAEDETIVLHSGNMGLKQDLGNVVAAARLADELPDARVRFVLMGDGSQRETLEAEAEGVGSMQFLPPADSSEFADILAAADVLLVNERPSSVDMSLPSKLTSYFRAGRPVIAASAAEGGTAVEIARSAAGVVVAPGVPAELLSAVQVVCADTEKAQQMGVLGTLYAEENLSADRALRSFAKTLVRVAKGLDGEPAVPAADAGDVDDPSASVAV